MTSPPLRLFAALAALITLTGCAPDPPPPPTVVTSTDPDSAGGGISGPTADEIDAGASILKDALRGASGQ